VLFTQNGAPIRISFRRRITFVAAVVLFLQLTFSVPIDGIPAAGFFLMVYWGAVGPYLGAVGVWRDSSCTRGSCVAVMVVIWRLYRLALWGDW
jgi:hypothetical protein